MNKKIHFICGLPRSGSTVLTAVLNQNPRFYSEITNPLSSIFFSVYNIICSNTNNNTNANEIKKRKMLNGILENYYCDVDKDVIFNTNRRWVSTMRLLVELQPDAKFIFCVRDVVSILNSFETYFNANPLHIPSLYYDSEEKNLLVSAHARSEYLYDRMILPGLFLIEEAMNGAYRNKIHFIEYDHLCEKPREIINELYDFLGEEYYDHDFNNVESSHERYDTEVNSPGLHTTKKVLQPSKRKLILPKETINKFVNKEIWRMPVVLENN
jgi:sulfotransferase